MKRRIVKRNVPGYGYVTINGGNLFGGISNILSSLSKGSSNILKSKLIDKIPKIIPKELGKKVISDVKKIAEKPFVKSAATKAITKASDALGERIGDELSERIRRKAKPLDKQTANELRLVNPPKQESKNKDINNNGVRESKQLPKKRRTRNF